MAAEAREKSRSWRASSREADVSSLSKTRRPYGSTLAKRNGSTLARSLLLQVPQQPALELPGADAEELQRRDARQVRVVDDEGDVVDRHRLPLVQADEDVAAQEA